VDIERARSLRESFGGSAWASRTRSFASLLRTAGHGPGGLLIVGTAAYDPWHLTAHLDDQARFTGSAELTPTLVRHHVPEGAPPHLAVGLSRLEAAGRGETLFVVAPTTASEGLLSRLDDARHAGATLLVMESGDRELQGLAHEALTIVDELPAGVAVASQGALVADGVLVEHDLAAAFETAQHLVSLAAGETGMNTGRFRLRRRRA
jgi:hypothetical protein